MEHGSTMTNPATSVPVWLRSLMAAADNPELSKDPMDRFRPERPSDGLPMSRRGGVIVPPHTQDETLSLNRTMQWHRGDLHHPQQSTSSHRREPEHGRIAVPQNSVVRDASVLLLFSGDFSSPEVPEDAHIVLTLRSEHLRKHSGQVAFPGGRVDAEDVDAVDTALREAREETGLNPQSVVPLATLPPFYIPVSSYSVSPVLAYWPKPAPSTLGVVDPREAARVMYTPVGQLLDPVSRFVLNYPSGQKGPAFWLDDLVIWGYTAGLLDTVFRLSGWEQEWDMTDVRDLGSVLNGKTGQIIVNPPRGGKGRFDHGRQ